MKHTHEDDLPKNCLKKRTGIALAFSALGNWVSMLIGMISLVVLSRILGPQPYGEFALLTACLALPMALLTVSLNESIIQHPRLNDGHLDTTFAAGLAGAFTFFIVVFFFSEQILSLLNLQDLKWPLYALLVILPLEAASTVPGGLLLRRLEYSAFAKVDIVSNLVSLTMSIGAALITASIWPLILGEISRKIIRLLLIFHYSGWRPGLQIGKVFVKDLIKFNGTISVIEILKVVTRDVPRFAIGSSLGVFALSYFNLATRLSDQLKSALVTPFGAVSFSVSSELSRTDQGAKQLLIAGIKLSSFFAYPAFLGMVAVAPIAIPLIFGPQWTQAVMPIQIACLIALRSPSTTMNTGIMKGFGKPHFALIGQALNVVLIILVLIVLLPLGLEAAMWGLLAQQLLHWLLSAWFVKRLTHVAFHLQFFAGWKSLVSSLLMMAGVLLVQNFLADVVPHWLLLLLSIAVGAFLFATLIIFLSPGLLSEAKALVSSGRTGYTKPKLEKLIAYL